MIYLILAAGLIVAYLIGSFSSSVWIGKTFYKIDVRTQGSKNAGATNTFRVLGIKPGIIVLLLDATKGFIAVSLAQWIPLGLEGEYFALYQLAMGICAITGHIFPIYTGFRGGKGVATIVGIIIALYPFGFFACLLGLFILVLCLSGYVSLASISSAIAFPILYYFVETYTRDDFYITFFVFSIVVAVFVPITHKKNIKRLLNGTENKFRCKKNNKQDTSEQVNEVQNTKD